MVFINFQKENKLQIVNPLTLTQMIQHYTIHNGAVKRWTSEPLMAAKKPKQHRVKPSKDNEEDRVSMWVFKSTNAWWRHIHVPIKKFIQKWVDPYSQPALSGEHKIISNDLYHTTMIMFVLKSIHIIAFGKQYNQAIVKAFVYIVNFCILKTLKSIFCKNIYMKNNSGVYVLEFESIALLMAHYQLLICL